MGEPVKLHKGEDKITVFAPSEVQRLINEGYELGEPAPQLEPETTGTVTAKEPARRRSTRKKTNSN